MKKQLTLVLAICLTVILIAIPDRSFAWGPDVTVNPVADHYYSKSRVTVAYDGTIYFGRLYATGSAASRMYGWEVLKSTNNGLTFTSIYSATVSASAKYTAFEILAAGNDPATFGLFVCRTYLDTATGDSRLILTKYNASGISTQLISEVYNYSTVRGWVNISLASDYREKNYNSNPYSISLAAVKAGGPRDSIIVWTDQAGGTDLHRKGITSTLGYFRNVSISAGSVTSETSVYGRIGIVYDFYQTSGAQYGGIRAMFLYTDNAAFPYYPGPYMIGLDSTSYRNPCIVLSQKTTTGTGFGEGDIRTMILYEYDGGAINGRMTDGLILSEPNFANYLFEVISGFSNNKNVHAVFDPVFDNYLITLYNESDAEIPYLIKGLNSPGDIDPILFEENFRDVDTYCDFPVEPRVDIRLTAMRAVFAWNDNGSSMFDAENSTASITENYPEAVQGIVLYPNPASDLVNIAFNSLSSQTVKLTVFDIEGRTVIQQTNEMTEGQSIIPLATDDLPPGQYVVTIASVAGNHSVKLLISR